MNRWLVVVGAILVQLCLGAIYAWSVFTPKLKEAGWSAQDTQAVFAAGLAAFAVVMVIAGRLMPKVGPRKLTIAGGVVLGLGYALAGLLGGTSFVFHERPFRICRDEILLQVGTPPGSPNRRSGSKRCPR